MTARTDRSVYWQDGMFMWPHHMQQEERLQGERIAVSHRWNIHHNWGVRKIEWDADAFKSGLLEIKLLQARMRDGTLVEIPAEGRLPTLDLNEILVGKDQVTVFLAVANLHEHRPNTAAAQRPDDADAGAAAPSEMRYLAEVFEVADENTGADPQVLEFRSLNLKLLSSGQETAGYEILEIARFEKNPEAGGAPQLDVNYIPPVLACDAWKPLSEGVLQTLYDHLSSRMVGLADKVISRVITFETQNPGDQKLLARLAVLNEGSTVLNTIAFAEGIHPFTAYLELSRLVGQLAIFGDSRRAPKIPAYDHDDLAGCFHWVKRYLEDDPDRDTFEERPFIGAGLRMQVAMEAKWLEAAWQMFVGVRSPLPQTEVIDLLTKPGQLDMKIGSSDRVDHMFTRGIKALEFTHAPHPPRVLPTMSDLTYFQVNRDAQKSEWAQVQHSLTLAIRVNHSRIVVGPQGDIQGQRVLALKQQGAKAGVTMEFALFLVPGEVAAQL
jgi:type VI secretion system protein ImpJ